MQDVGEFVSSSDILHYITCSSTDPLQWMGAVRMRVQTADKYFLERFWTVFCFKYLSWFWQDVFLLEKAEDLYFSQKQQFKVLNILRICL